MGGEQAATVLATITKDQRAREGKEVRTGINHPVCACGKSNEVPQVRWRKRNLSTGASSLVER